MRLKIIAGNLIAVLVLGLASYFFLNSQIKSTLGTRADNSVHNAQILFARSWRLSGLELVRDVSARAQERDMIDVFAGLDDSSRRTRAFQAADRAAAWLGDPARRGSLPDIVVLTDETGRVIARNADPNRMFGQLLAQQLPALRGALSQGGTALTVWDKEDDGKILQTAIAPIRGDQGNVIGALVVAYDISNGLIGREAQALGADVAILTDGKIYSSSLADRRDALRAFLFAQDATGAATTQALAGGVSGATSWRANLSGDDYVGATAHLDYADNTHAAYVVLTNRTAAVSLASQTNVILYLTLLFALVIIGYGSAVGTSLIRPVEQIEETILAIINGRPDLRIELEHPDYGGLAYRINQLLNAFMDIQEDMSDEDGRISHVPDNSAWNDKAFGENANAAGGGAAAPAEPIDDPALASKLEGEAEGAYFDRIYSDFVAQKQAVGENVSAMTKDKFIQRFKGMADAHAKKHGVRAVRYQIETIDGQVQVRPVLIR